MNLNKESWENYLAYRNEQKLRKLKAMSIQRITQWLSNYEQDTQADIVDTTIRNGWIGLFPPKDVKKSVTPKTHEDWERYGKDTNQPPKRGETFPQYIARLKSTIQP